MLLQFHLDKVDGIFHCCRERNGSSKCVRPFFFGGCVASIVVAISAGHIRIDLKAVAFKLMNSAQNGWSGICARQTCTHTHT